MVKLGETKQEDRSRAIKYHSVGRALHATANDLATLGEAKYGNGLAIMAIHAAIAYTDALTVAYREIKSTDGKHVRAADVLLHALGHRADSNQVDRLRSILDAKSDVSYRGNYYTIADGRRILHDTDRYIAWAERKFTDRPSY